MHSFWALVAPLIIVQVLEFLDYWNQFSSDIFLLVINGLSLSDSYGSYCWSTTINYSLKVRADDVRFKVIKEFLVQLHKIWSVLPCLNALLKKFQRLKLQTSRSFQSWSEPELAFVSNKMNFERSAEVFASIFDQIRINVKLIQ